MARTVGIGIRQFDKIIQGNYFYVDKTAFIKEWWNSFFLWTMQAEGICLNILLSGKRKSTGSFRELIR